MPPRIFPIAYSKFTLALNRFLGIGPKRSGVTVSDEQVHVRMGWAFDGTIPRSRITSAARAKKPRLAGWGVHGWNGRWTVNGSDRGIVKLTIDPAVHVRTVIFAINLRELYISLEDPEGFVEALGVRS